MIIQRRAFLRGAIASFIAAPAVIRVAELMPIKVIDDPIGIARFIYDQEHIELAMGYAITRKNIDDAMYKAQFGYSDILARSMSETKAIYAANILGSKSSYT